MAIAVIRFSSLGDVVLVTALFQKLADTYPDCDVDFITDGVFAGLFSTDPRIRMVIPYDISKESARYLLGFLRRFRRERYDLVIDAHCNPRSLIVSSLARTEERRRVPKYGWQRRSMVRHRSVRTIPHMVQRYLAAVDGGGSADYRPRLYVNGGEGERIRREVKRTSGGKPVVGIAPGAAKRTKLWDTGKLKELVHILSGHHGLFLVFLGGRSDTPLIDAISKPLRHGYLSLAGKTDFRELAQYLAACDVVLSTDSGPMHVAVAVNTPVVALFGPTVCEFGFRPYDERSITLSVDLACRPCSLHGTDSCPQGHHRCMKDIEVKAVEEAIIRVLTGGKQKRRARERGHETKPGGTKRIAS